MYQKPTDDIFSQHVQAQLLLLKEVAAQKGLTQAELAERTGFTQSNISRMFDAKYLPTYKNFCKLAHAVGIRFFLEDIDGTSDLNLAFEKAMGLLKNRPEDLPKN